MINMHNCNHLGAVHITLVILHAKKKKKRKECEYVKVLFRPVSVYVWILILLMFASIAKGICINDTELPMCSALASKRRQQVY